ncbi:MAG: hypothetical protein VYE40_00075 [Myxococcota bacterium]|nr:hypothetical protein [Myxococcota bacterium]
MNHLLNSMIARAEGEYLEREAQELIIDFVSELPQRFALMNELARSEGAILEDTLATFYERFPMVAQRHRENSPGGVRDLRLVLRYASMAYVLDDLRYLDEKLLSWLRPILHSYLETEAIDFAFASLVTTAREHLSRRVGDLISPYLERSRDLLV